MKKYAITLGVLAIVGILLTIVLFTQDKKLDQTVFLKTTESIRNLQKLDKNLLVLLNQSRFNSKFDHEQLLETSYQLSEEFSNLRYEALFEEIESSEELSKAVRNFDEQYASREEELENYVLANESIAKSLARLPEINQTLNASNEQESNPQFKALLGEISTKIFLTTLGKNQIETDWITEYLNELVTESPTEILDETREFKNQITSIANNIPDAETSFLNIKSLKTGPLLDEIEKKYVDYHNQAIGGSNLFRNALIIYGVSLLVALIFFGLQIRKNYLFLEQEVEERTKKVNDAYKELQESQEQLIQSEKMASLGQMVAGVAHEINTPLGYVTSNVDTLKYNLKDMSEVVTSIGDLNNLVYKKNRDNKAITQGLLKTIRYFKEVEADELIDESTQLLNDGAYGLNEISKLVSSLKDFARLDRQSSEQVDIHDCIKNALTIASNHIRENGVTVIKEYADLPPISCIPSKLNQLFLNIITNACQAMSDSNGTLSIRTENSHDKITISFTDTGIGMDEETRQKMFDPFFTSKEIGEGTGLGLSIAYKIIEAHKGTIEVETELGIGTTIKIELPIQ